MSGEQPAATGNEPKEPVTKEARLFHNVALGDMGDVIEMLDSDRSLDINIQDLYGNTLLHWSSYRGNMALVQYLLEKGAAVAIPNNRDGHTPLHWAALQGEIEIVNMLMEHKAPVNVVDLNGHTPLFFAADNNRSVVVHMLLRSGANVRVADLKQRTPLHMAAAKGYTSVVSLLMAAGAHIDAQDEDGRTAVFLAAKYDKDEVIEDLCRDGNADIEIRAKDGTSPLDVAAPIAKKFIMTAKARPRDYFKKEGHTNHKIVRTSVYAFVMHIIAVTALSMFDNILGWIVGLAGTVAWGFFMFYFLAWPARDERNFFFAALAFVTYVTMMYKSWFQIWPALADAEGFTLVTWWVGKVAEFGLFWSYFILLFRYKDPGIIPVHEEHDYQILAGRDLKKAGNVVNICAPCQQRRPLRSKHVRQTGSCVARFDHYCDWIGNAVGEKNHKPFLAFVFFVDLHCLCYVWLAFQAFPTLANMEFWYERLYQNLGENGLLAFTLLEALFFLIVMGAQLGQQLALVANNLTMNEAINLPRYRYFFNKNNEFVNPFDRGGAFENFKDFMNPSTDWYKVCYVRDLPHLPDKYLANDV